jgi:oligoendopeptidase F
MLAKDTDMRVTKYLGMDNRIKSLYTKVFSAAAFVRPELLTLSAEKLEKFLSDKPELELYRHFFDDLFRTKLHTLNKEQEELLASAGEIAGFPYDTFSVFTNADIEFPVIKDEAGEDIKLSHGRYQAALYSQDRDYRQNAFIAYYKPYRHFANTIANLFNANLKSKIFFAKARKYENSLEASLDANNIPVRVYETLIEMVSRNLQPMHRWMALKKKLLNVETFHPYDVYVSLFEEKNERTYSYDEAVSMVKDSLQVMGPDYRSILDNAFSNRWIDVYETEGKRSGAYSSGTTFGVHPYVLLNWNGLLNDVFTLAHEMGHNVHSYLTGKHQPFVYADYSIFLAEIASTFNEALLFEYLLERVETREEKLALLERYLNNISATFYRQTMFAEFELASYRAIEQGEALTSDSLKELYKTTYAKFMGPELTIDEEEHYTWARVPHFYYNFYVYQYATGFAASEALVAKVKKEGAPAVEKYLDFLKSGRSDYPLAILKKSGVDMLTPEPTSAVARRMNAVLDQIEKLI